MNAAHEHERMAEDVGAYLLGALEDNEEKAFEDHLDGCHVCQEEVERLSLAVEALPSSVDQYAPPPELKKTLMAAVRQEAKPARAPRKSWRERLVLRPAFAGALAAAFLAVGIAVGLLINSGDTTSTQTRVASVDTTRLPGTATASLVTNGGSAVLKVSGMPQPSGNDVYEVWARRGDKVVPVSLFDVKSDGSGSAGVPDTGGVDRIYITREQRGGADTPSEKPVVSIDL